MSTFWQDLRYGMRMLRRNSGFTAAAVICLMLGIGATTAIFSVVNAVLLRPLPYAQPSHLVRVYTEFPNFPNGGLRRFWSSGPEFLQLRRDTRSWETLDAWIVQGSNLAGRIVPARVTTAYVSGTMLQTLKVQPVMGRLIIPSDDDPKAPVVADISYGLWRGLFGGDPNIVGRETDLDGQKCTIVGVMPRSFEFPPGEADKPEVWSPLQLDPANPGSAGSHYLYLLGRLKNGVTAAQAQAELQALVNASDEKATPKNHVFSPTNHTLVSYPLQTEVTSGVRPALLVLLGAVGFVLLIACVNIANLLLARAEARRREIAIREALGAGLPRLARQFATEGVLLALCGAALGLALAFGGVKVIQLTNAGGIPRAAEMGLDWRVLAFTLATSLVTGVMFGLAPIVPLMVQDLYGSLKDAGASATPSAGAQVFRRALVAGELAFALVLLIGCGLMVRAFWKLQAVRTGVQAENVITMQVSLPGATYTHAADLDGFWNRLEGKLGSLPGARFAALASGLPPARRPNFNDTDIEGFVPRTGGPVQNVDFYQIVSKDYFAATGIRLMEGRVFDDRDTSGGPGTVVINQTMARTFWPDQDPVGRRLRPGYGQDWATIIGVVEDVKNAGLDQATGTELYIPYRQKPGAGQNPMYVVVRGQGDPSRLVGAVRADLNELDSTVPLSAVKPMDEVISRAQSRPRFLTLLMTLFSVVALAIATVGIYGVISYSVARRTKEFGLRMVLGAQQGDVLGLVMKQGAGLALAGLLAGVAGAVALTAWLGHANALGTLLFGVKPTDPATFASVAGLLAAVALAASYIPARRATKVDPMQTLRYE